MNQWNLWIPAALNIYEAMIENYSNQLLQEMELHLAQVAEAGQEPFDKLNLSLSIIRKNLNLLKHYLQDHPFSNDAEEISFFKEIKPKFYWHLIYEIKGYNIFENIPFANLEQREGYYVTQLKFVINELQQNQFQYQYFKLKAKELDSLYFIRRSDIQSALIPQVPELDASFSTSCSYLFSKFIAYERLQNDIQYKLNKIEGPADIIHADSNKEKSVLKWTGDKINLVELIYGLYFTGQLNDGNADLATIIAFMEQHLQIDLSRAYRDFIDIKNRKRSSPTRYIENMRESIHKKIDDDLALKHPPRRPN